MSSYHNPRCSATEGNYKIYKGSRGQDFTNLILRVLQLSKLKKQYINILTTPTSMKLYSKAFTSKTADAENNSEVLELLGDVTANKFIPWYMFRRFPQLNCTLGVKVLARLKINYASKKSFFDISKNLGFWPFISASDEERSRCMKPLLEDAMEAFVGATELILDCHFVKGVGNSILYDILSTIFDNMDISLKYTDLIDAKTRLKEVADTYKEKLGKMIFKEERNDIVVTSTISICSKCSDDVKLEKFYTEMLNKIQRDRQLPNPKQLLTNQKQYIKHYDSNHCTKIGQGSAALKADAQQRASAVALEYLRSEGFYKSEPNEYMFFQQGKRAIVGPDGTTISVHT
jgi:dsRNA-specific ribonuclease